MATVTVKQSLGEYSTLASALSSRTVGGDIISIEGTWSVADTASCTVSYAVTITADADSAFKGVYTSSIYRHEEASGHAFTLNADLTITGVFIESQSTTASDEIFRINADSLTLTAKKCGLGFNSRNSEQDIVYTNTKDGLTIDFENCAFWNVQRSVIDVYNSIGTNTFKFNSCIGYDIGYSATTGTRSGIVGTSVSSGTFNTYMFNNVFHINTGYVFNASSNGTHTVDYTSNITNAATFASGADTETDGGGNTLSTTFVQGNPAANQVGLIDITTAPFNLKLFDDADNVAQDNHTSGTGSTLTMPSTDVAGTTRPVNTNYDIGFFEVAAAGGATGKSNPLHGPLSGPLTGMIG